MEYRFTSAGHHLSYVVEAETEGAAREKLIRELPMGTREARTVYVDRLVVALRMSDERRRQAGVAQTIHEALEKANDALAMLKQAGECGGFRHIPLFQRGSVAEAVGGLESANKALTKLLESGDVKLQQPDEY